MTEPEDPPRLVDPESSASPRLRRLIEASRADVGTRAEIQTLEAGLLPIIGSAGAGTGAAAGAVAKAGGGIALKIGVVAVVAASAGGVYLAVSRTPHAERRPAENGAASLVMPSVSRPAAPVVPLVEAPVASAEPQTSSVPAATASATKGTGRGPATAESVTEADLLDRAQAALSGDPARALSLAGEHARKFPRGVLGQEREVIAVEALAKLGRGAEARARGDQFLRLFPKSAYRSKIESVLSR